MLPVGILGGGDQLEVIQGDAYYQSYICRIPRSTIELGADRPPRLPRRHALPVDLRRDPQPLGHVADAVPGQVRRATSTCRRTSSDAIGGAFYIQRAARSLRDDLGKLRGAPITDDELNASIARLQREPRARSASSTPPRRRSPGRRRRPRSTWCCAPGMVLPVEEHTQLVREYLAAADARAAAEARQRARRAHRRVLRAAAARPHQVDRDGRLLHRRRRLHAGHALAARTTCPPTAIRSTSCRRPSCTARRRPRAKYDDDDARTRACSSLEAGQDARRRGRDLRRAVVLRPGAARAADAAGRARPSTACPTPRSSTPRTPARCRRSASRPARSPIRSSSGAPHERHPIQETA